MSRRKVPSPSRSNASAERVLDEAHSHWRVRHTDDEQVRLEDGDARFSYGADGETFTPLRTHALPAVSDVRLGLALRTFGDIETSTADGAALRVEGLNAE